MRATTILIFLNLAFLTPLTAQYWDWVKTIYGFGFLDITSEAIATDVDGNCYVTGIAATGMLTHGSTVASMTLGESYIAKYDSNGNSGWINQIVPNFGGGLWNVFYTNDMEYNPGKNQLYLSGRTQYWYLCEFDYWGTMVFDTAGNYVSNNSATYPSFWLAESYITDIAVNSAGRGLLQAIIQTMVLMLPVLPVRIIIGDIIILSLLILSLLYTILFSVPPRHFLLFRAMELLLLLLPENSTYVIGNFNDSAFFVTAPASPYNSTHSSIVKYSSWGNFMWHKMFVSLGSSQVKARSIATSAQGDVFILGTTTGDFTFDSVTVPINSSWGNGVFLVRLNSNGDLIWAKTFPYQGGFSFNKLVVADNGNAYIAGFLNGKIKLSSNVTLYSNNNLAVYNIYAPMAIIAIDSMGKYRFHEQVDGGAIPKSIKLSLDQNSLYVTGQMANLMDTVTFPGQNGILTIMDSLIAQDHVFTAKLKGVNRAVNDDCSQSIPLTQHSFCLSIQGSTFTGTESFPADSCNGVLGNPDDDVWFSFDALSSDPIIEVSSSLDMVIELWDSCGGNQIHCANQFLGINSTEIIQSTGLNIGQKYFIRVYTADSSRGKFDICVYYTNNDNPCNAIALPQDGTPLTGLLNTFATVDSNEQVLTPSLGSCNSDSSWCMGDITGIQKSVWFSFIGPDSGKVDLSTCWAGTNFNTQISVYSVIDCNDFNTFTLIGANDDGNSCANGESFITLYCLTPGETYYVMVDGFSGDSGYFDISMTPHPYAINLSVSTTSASCIFDSSGMINLSVSGGEAPYIYLWSTGDTTADLNNYPPGNYSVTVTDICGNTRKENFEIDSMSISLLFTFSSTSSTCPLNPDGGISVTPSNGIPPYAYSWSNGSTTQNLTGVSSGLYSVAISDACQNEFIQGNIFFPAVNTLSIIDFIDHNTCPDDSNGNIFAIPSGGSGGYSFLWSTGDTTDKIVNQLSGVYTLMLSDSCGNNRLDTFEIQTMNSVENAEFLYVDSVFNQYTYPVTPLILGVAGGSFFTNSPELIVDSATGEIDFCQSLPGTYQVYYMSPGIGACSGQESFPIKINAAPDLSVLYSLTQPDCPDDTNGSIQIQLIGGRSPYQFLWGDGDTASFRNNLGPGNYLLSVWDDCNDQLDTSLIVESVFMSDIAVFSYDSLKFCLGGPNPFPLISGTQGGSFSVDSAGLIFTDPSTGEIDLQQSQEGNYLVTYITSGNCPDTSTISLVLENCNTGLGYTLRESGLILYPNPAKEKVWLSLNQNDSEEMEVIVYDASGRKIIHRPSQWINRDRKTEFDLSGFSEGIYLFQIIRKGENRSYYQKILKL
ncbi:MAG: T9SS type A sorting domain-containing protein [Bacteroidia bacterium]